MEKCYLSCAHARYIAQLSAIHCAHARHPVMAKRCLPCDKICYLLCALSASGTIMCSLINCTCQCGYL